MSKTIFTSESVAAGHPDKMADQISDAVLDAILEQDPHCRVACETLVKTGMVLIAGEISTHAWVDLEALARKTIVDIGYHDAAVGFDGQTCAVLNAIGKQSPDIAQGVDQANDLGAGDQGLMFGFACDETDVLMPAPITYAHRLMERHAQLKQSEAYPWIWPDAKCQVSVIYDGFEVVGVDSIVFSTQHAPEASQATIESVVREEMINAVIPQEWLTDQTRYCINPTGRFVIGGPQGDCGLTGRKIIVDTYGGMARHGGGCFSGKDPSKVDRSAAYMARHIAKSIVAQKLAKRCEVQLAYAIGIAEPMAIHVETFGTSELTEAELIAVIKKHFNLTPQGIIEHLDLLKPCYQPTAAYGHFGREDLGVTWENCQDLSV